jgi:hypothetical protein
MAILGSSQVGLLKPVRWPILLTKDSANGMTAAFDASPSFTRVGQLSESSHSVHLDLRSDPGLLAILHKSRISHNACVCCRGGQMR